MNRRKHCQDVYDAPQHTTWNLDPRDGVVQGPMDIAFLRRGAFTLILEEGQVALMTVRGKVTAAYFSGAHLLEVGDEDTTVPGNGLLYFVHLDQQLVVPWRQHMPILPSAAWDEEARRAQGTFTVRVTDPVAFHASFLSDRGGEGEEICRDALSHLLPTLMAIHLSQSPLDGSLAEAVAALDPAALDAELATYGVACTGMTMTAPSAAPHARPAQEVETPVIVGV